MESEVPLASIATRLRKGDDVGAISVRELLAWFGQQRRGAYVVGRIREALETNGLTTEPDFEGEFIDSEIKLTLARKNEVEGSRAGEAIARGDADSRFRLRVLPSAHRRPLAVSPNSSLSEAVTLMLRHDYSQLPVMNGPRDVRGIVSWETIGRNLTFDPGHSEVRMFMKTVPILPMDVPLLEAIRDIVEKECILVRDDKKEITGIVTTSDLSVQFQELTEPFLLLSEIENQLRDMIIQRGGFTASEIQKMFESDGGKKPIRSVSDLSFGQYATLLGREDCWARLRTAADRRTFIVALDQVRAIRNDVMHFNADPNDIESISSLRKFSRFLEVLLSYGPAPANSEEASACPSS